MIVRSSTDRCDKSGGLPGTPPIVEPAELEPPAGPKPELVLAAKPESDMPPPELPMLLPKALSVAARQTAGPAVFTPTPAENAGSLPVWGPPPADITVPPAGELVIIRGGPLVSTSVVMARPPCCGFCPPAVVMPGAADAKPLADERIPDWGAPPTDPAVWLVVTVCISMVHDARSAVERAARHGLSVPVTTSTWFLFFCWPIFTSIFVPQAEKIYLLRGSNCRVSSVTSNKQSSCKAFCLGFWYVFVDKSNSSCFSGLVCVWSASDPKKDW